MLLFAAMSLGHRFLAGLTALCAAASAVNAACTGPLLIDNFLKYQNGTNNLGSQNGGMRYHTAAHWHADS